LQRHIWVVVLAVWYFEAMLLVLILPGAAAPRPLPAVDSHMFVLTRIMATRNTRWELLTGDRKVHTNLVNDASKRGGSF
jgi:hypothetical protein